MIVEPAALASNCDPLIFDAPNELIFGAADIENNSGDASSDTSGGGGRGWEVRREFYSLNIYNINAYS